MMFLWNGVYIRLRSKITNIYIEREKEKDFYSLMILFVYLKKVKKRHV